jgi:hypothetical protein
MFANLFLKIFKSLIPMGSAIVANYPKLRELILQALAGQIGREQLGSLLSSQGSNKFSMSRFPSSRKASNFLKNMISYDVAVLAPGVNGETTFLSIRLKNLLKRDPKLTDLDKVSPLNLNNLDESQGLLLFSDAIQPRSSVREVLYWSAQNSDAGIIAFTKDRDNPENQFRQFDLAGNISVGLGSHGVWSIFIPQSVLATEGFQLPKSVNFSKIVKHLKDFTKGTDIQLFTLSLGDSDHDGVGQIDDEKDPDETRNILVIQPIWTGGLKITSDRIYERLAKSHSVYVLRASTTKIDIFQIKKDKEKLIFSSQTSPMVQAWNHFSSEYDMTIAKVISHFDIDLVHVEHLAWQSLGLADVSGAYGVPVIFSAHDFYSVCASHTLLDENLSPCFGKCLPGTGSCSTTIWPISTVSTLKNNDVSIWQRTLQEFLKKCAFVIAPSQSVADLLNDTYPSVTQIRVIEHPKPELSPSKPNSGVDKSELIKVLVLGDISVNKGALLIKKIHERDINKRLEFHFLGSTWPGIQGFGVHHGSYRIQELSSIVERIMPSVGLVPAIGQETYSLTLSELWTLGVPVVATNYGALAERITTHGGGLLASPDNPDDWINSIEFLAWDAEIRERAIFEIESWQKFADANLDIDAVSKSYLDVFNASISKADEQIA